MSLTKPSSKMWSAVAFGGWSAVGDETRGKIGVGVGVGSERGGWWYFKANGVSKWLFKRTKQNIQTPWNLTVRL